MSGRDNQTLPLYERERLSSSGDDSNMVPNTSEFPVSPLACSPSRPQRASYPVSDMVPRVAHARAPGPRRHEDAQQLPPPSMMTAAALVWNFANPAD